jgi:stage II sporulation protein D
MFDLKPGAFPYLCRRSCDFCKGSPFWKQKVSQLPRRRFNAAFGSGLPKLLAGDESGRPLSFRLADGRRISGWSLWQQIGQKFGWDKVPGTRFKFEPAQQGDENFVTVESTGAGHGVGLCQWGASEQARQGKSYKEILEYYFPGTTIEPIK